MNYVFVGRKIKLYVINKFKDAAFARSMNLTLPAVERTGILGSTRPLKLDTLQCLAQRWDSPQATLGMPYPRSDCSKFFFI